MPTTATPIATSTPRTASMKKPTPDMPLAELRQIKHDWVTAARDLDYPNITWKALAHLGRREKFGVLREANYWESGVVRVIGDETTAKYGPAHNTFITRRYLAAYVMPNELDPRWSKPEQAIMQGIQVMRWAWLLADTPDGQIIEEDEGEKKDALLFVPGQWMNAILAVQHAANLKEAAAYQAAIERQRQEILAELLVGVAV